MWWIFFFLILVAHQAPGDCKLLHDRHELISKMDKIHAAEKVQVPRDALIVGPCSTSCGVGIQNIYGTSGCPQIHGCLVGVQECRRTTNCGWGKVVNKTRGSVEMSCNSINDDYRFKYVWKVMELDNQPRVLPNTMKTLQVNKKLHDVTYQCDTFEDRRLVGTIKFNVTSTAIPQAEVRQAQKREDVILNSFILVTILLLCIMITVTVFFGYIWLYFTNMKRAGVESEGDIFIDQKAAPVSSIIVIPERQELKEQEPESAPASATMGIDTAVDILA